MKPSLRSALPVLAAVSLAPSLGAQSVDEVVAEVREAVGYDALEASDDVFLLRGRADVNEDEARWWLAYDSRGHFAEEKSGQLPYSLGFDGETCWNRDRTDTPTVLRARDRDMTLARAALYTHYWLSDEQPLLLEVSEAGGDTITLTWRVAEGTLEGELHVDAETSLPVRMIAGRGEAAQTYEITEFDDSPGFRQPRAWRELNTIGLVNTYTATRFTRTADETLFEPKLHRPEGVRFDPDVPAALTTKRVASGHLLVRARVAEQEAWFIFDTGAGTNCIDRSFAEEVGLAPFGRIMAAGVGGRIETVFRAGADLTLGPMTLERPQFMELDLSFLEGPLGVRIAGILGYEVLQRAVVAFDLEASSVALHDPDVIDVSSDSWDELLVYERHPCVRARFEDGAEEWFKLDTGAGGTLTFHAPAVRRLALLDGRETTASNAGGVGGGVPTRSGTIESFELGGHRFETPTVEFALEDVGAFADSFAAGNIGTAFLRPFEIWFDYGRSRVRFEPHARD